MSEKHTHDWQFVAETFTQDGAATKWACQCGVVKTIEQKPEQA